MKQLLTLAQASEYLGVSEKTFRRLVLEEGIPYVPMGDKTKRFRAESIDRWIAERERSDDGQ